MEHDNKAKSDTPQTITFALENLEKVVDGLNETAGLSKQIRDIFDRTDDRIEKVEDKEQLLNENLKVPNMVDIINRISGEINSQKCFIHENMMYLKNKLK